MILWEQLKNFLNNACHNRLVIFYHILFYVLMPIKKFSARKENFQGFDLNF